MDIAVPPFSVEAAAVANVLTVKEAALFLSPIQARTPALVSIAVICGILFWSI